MKVGDYVRIKWGNGLQTISKCKNIVDMGDTQYSKDDFYIHTDHSGEVIYKTMIVKSSPNIIDLIEVGDYVNGKKVVDKQYHYTDKDNYDIGEWCIFYENVALGDYQYNIKSIVTKEQFESMEYKIGE